MATFDYCQIEMNNSSIWKLVKTIKQAHNQYAWWVKKFQLSKAGSSILKPCIIGLIWEETTLQRASDVGSISNP